MPGITGIIGPSIPNGAATSQIDAMVRCLAHEPDFVTGSLRNDDLALQLGWASRPGSAAGCALAWNGRRDTCLLFFGDDFGPGANTAESLILLYEKRGPGFLLELNGCFSGLLVDLRQQKVILFNDRYGLSRIYLHESPDGFFFSSEAKSLLAVLPQLRQIDQRGLAEFFSVGCVLQNRSLFQGISLLPGGAMWTFHRDGRIDQGRYFDPKTWEQQEILGATAYSERLREVFGRITPHYLKGPRRVGMSLTGGLDGRMIMAWAKAAPGSLPCYTFGGRYRDCADVRIARKLAKICGQPHTTIPMGNDFFTDFPALAEKTVWLTDGAMDVSGAVELYVNRLAREIAPVRLTGNYGSEILRSNVAFRPGSLDTALFTPEFCRLLGEAAETYRSEAAGHRLSFIAFKQIPWHHYARLAVEKSQLAPRTPFLDNELVALAYQAPLESAGSTAPLLQLITEGNPALGSVGTDRALRRRPLPILTRLATAWQEFTAKAEYAYDYGMPGWLAQADHAVARLHVERLFLGRHKFYHFRVWYRDQLGGYLRASLDSGDSPSCYRDGSVGKIVRGHLSGRSNRTLELHKLLSVQLIEKLLLRSPCPD